MRVGWIRHEPKWFACEGNRQHSQILDAALHVAAVNLQLIGVFSVRFGSNVRTLSGLYCDESLICWWTPGQFQTWSYAFADGSKPINLQNLGGEKVAFVQFLMEDGIAIAELRQINADVANIGGVYDPRMPLIREVPLNSPTRNNPKIKMLADKPDSSLSSPKDNVAMKSDEMADDDEVHPNADVPQSESSDHELLPDEGTEQELDVHIGWTCSAEPPTEPCALPLEVQTYVFDDSELDQPAELEISQQLSPYVVSFYKVNPEHKLVFSYHTLNSSEVSSQAVIERTHNVLTREEALQNLEACRASMLKELGRWHKHGAWVRFPLKDSRNLLRSKWVLKWKDISGKRDVKARLVAQGFLDQQSLSTFAGTTSRWGQRIVVAFAVQFGWKLVSADVSEAFLRGITFQELHSLDPSQPLRKVEISLPPGTAELIRSLPGMSDYDGASECLSLCKPGFGLKDAPRLWNLALNQVLSKADLQAANTDKQLYFKHNKQGKLILLLSIHVDDLKITGEDVEINAVLKLLTDSFDELKLATDNFEHLGLKHNLENDGSRTLSQEHYIAELRFIPEDGCKGSDDPVSADMRSKFMSLLGGVAWTVQTRPDIAVFTAALQRKLQNPTGRDVVNLNRVLAYLKRKPLKFTFRKVNNPWRLYVISDSSFKGEDDDALAMRSGIIALGDKDGPKIGDNPIQILEFVSKKQTRVCRSTFTAELYSALDVMSLGNLINLALTEVLTGSRTASTLADVQENGENTLQADLILDAKSVYECVSAADTKTTTDKLMLIHALKLKELLALRISSRLLWVDTRDMLSDALNKGIISRDAIRRASENGIWKVAHNFKLHVEARTRPKV